MIVGGKLPQWFLKGNFIYFLFFSCTDFRRNFQIGIKHANVKRTRILHLSYWIAFILKCLLEGIST